jgi:tetratricopeptide (TPR) repeat protein
VKVAIGYVAFAALAMEVTSNLMDAGVVSFSAFRWLLVALIAGLPIALVAAWAQARAATAEGSTAPARVEVRASYLLAGLTMLVLVTLGAWYLSSRQPGATATVEAAADGFPPTNVAVLPLQDYSAEDNRYLAAGITGLLTQYLASIEALDVLSYPAMRQYQAEGLPLDSIVRRHHRGTLIEGYVIASAEEIQVSVSLIDGSTLTQVAGPPPLARPRGESPALLRELTEEVARALRRRLGIQIRRRAVEAGTNNAAALELLFRGEDLTGRARPLIAAGDTAAASASLAKADSVLALAESLDPDWAAPSVARGWVAALRASSLTSAPGRYDADVTRRGIRHAEHALGREPDNAEALQLRGILWSYLAGSLADPDAVAGAWNAAEQDLTRAVEVNPSLSAAWSRLSLVYREQGRFADAKQAAERALQEDVWLYNDETIIVRLCQTSLDLEQFADAIRWCAEEGRQRFPGRAGFVSAELVMLASSVGLEPDVGRAWHLADTLVMLIKPHRRDATRPRAWMDVAAVIARAGLRDSALAVVARARAAAPQPDVRLDYREANVRLQLGEREEAIRLLARYLDARPDRKAVTAKDWWWRPLRDDPEFQALVR